MTIDIIYLVELYKAGHHGSKTSSSSTLMAAIKPKRVCVCCCAGSSQYTSINDNRFPTQAFINNVAPYTDEIYVTTLCVDFNSGNFESMNGNVVFYSNNNEKVFVACSNNSLILRETDWFQVNRKMPTAWVE